jgi:hypothetical protein
MTEQRKQQAQILQEMGTITRMRRGHLTEQYNRQRSVDGTERRWGPYYTLQAWVGGKNRSVRIPAEVAPQVRQDIANYAAFTELCERYVAVAEGRAQTEVAESKKKHRRSRPPSGGRSRSS